MVSCVPVIRVWVLLLSLAFVPHGAAGQVVTALTASVTGTVTDSSGAVTPGVTVVIASPSQMGTRETISSFDGR